MWGWSQFGLAALAASQNISLGSSALDSWMLPILQEEVMRWWRERGVERVENKAINVIGCLDRGQREDRRREGRKNRKRGGKRLSSSLLSALWRGQEDAKSAGCLCAGSQQVCEDPSVHLSVPICPPVPC